MSLNPYSIIHEFVIGGLQWVLETLGITGIAATALLTALLWLYWGMKVRRYGQVGRSVAGTVMQHALVSSAVAVLAVAGLLVTGIIPGVDLDAAMALVNAGIDFIGGLIP